MNRTQIESSGQQIPAAIREKQLAVKIQNIYRAAKCQFGNLPAWQKMQEGMARCVSEKPIQKELP